MNVAVTVARLWARRWMRVSVCVPMLLACTALGVGAQSGSGDALTIADVIAATLRTNPDVRMARAAVDAARGALLQAARPFDTRSSGTFGGSRLETKESAAPTHDPRSLPSMFVTESRLGVSQTLRSGLTFGAVTTTRTASRVDDRPNFNQFTTAATVTVPLLLDRGGGLATAYERAATLAHGASERTLRDVASAALLRATQAYWEYCAAFRRAEILRAAAARSQQSVRELEILVTADERPRSDIDLMLANAATKHSLKLEAERQVVHAYNALALVIGLDQDVARTLPVPLTDFPDADQIDPLPLEPLVADALSRHDGLAAALTHQKRAQVLREGAASQFRPRVDLVFGTEFTGEFTGGSLTRLGPGFNNLLLLGPNASVQLVFEPSHFNSSARGGKMQADAEYTHATIAAEAVSRAVRLSVADALTGLHSSRAQLASTREAVARSRLARETIERNFELGAATLFDRILGEDTVTNAETADLTARVRYATALVELQFARGVLVGGHGADLLADQGRVLRATREDVR